MDKPPTSSGQRWISSMNCNYIPNLTKNVGKHKKPVASWGKKNGQPTSRPPFLEPFRLHHYLRNHWVPTPTPVLAISEAPVAELRYLRFGPIGKLTYRLNWFLDQPVRMITFQWKPGWSFRMGCGLSTDVRIASNYHTHRSRKKHTFRKYMFPPIMGFHPLETPCRHPRHPQAVPLCLYA